MDPVERELLFLAESFHKDILPNVDVASHIEPILQSARLLRQGNYVGALASPIVRDLFHDASYSSRDAVEFRIQNFPSRFLASVHARVSEIACKGRKTSPNNAFESAKSEGTGGIADLEQNQSAAVLVAGVACLCIFVQANFLG